MVAVLAEHERPDVAPRHAEFRREFLAEPQRVGPSRSAEHPRGRKVLGEHVHPEFDRVRLHDHDRRHLAGGERPGELLEHGSVAPSQRSAVHRRPGIEGHSVAGEHHHDVRIDLVGIEDEFDPR